ncbi:hypothetical protein JRI60_09125 [Archangium violaceum]|uniref:hypothetical protein n=1 Tax=Archangium violaceum TaxID=83451 RepID=UPI0019524CCA|nr:hypothetical protein [Archangium violaceum]QRN99159.1 hypothetical protein JRI60_09125 [Archangium violaceum]
MSDKNTRTLRSESSAVSLSMELTTLEHALRGASLLAELLANHDLPEEETQRMAPHCISAQLALVNARLRHMGRVIRGEEDAETLWAPYNATSPSPRPGDDEDVRLVSKSAPLFARSARKTTVRKPRARRAEKRPEKPPPVDGAQPAP